MPKYRKKPVEVEARRLTEADWKSIAEWCGAVDWPHEEGDVKDQLAIPTFEGLIWANIGDYIICGVQGEFYPCKPEIFEATYEPVED